MIIKCHTCETKYSVDSSKISGLANPKFHCSRCNTYFFHNNEQEGAKSLSLLTKSAADDGAATQLELIPGPVAKIKKRKFRANKSVVDEEQVTPIAAADWPDQYIEEALYGSSSTHSIERVGKIMAYGQPMLEGNIFGNTLSVTRHESELSYSPISWPSESLTHGLANEHEWEISERSAESFDSELDGLPAIDSQKSYKQRKSVSRKSVDWKHYLPKLPAVDVLKPISAFKIKLPTNKLKLPKSPTRDFSMSLQLGPVLKSAVLLLPVLTLAVMLALVSYGLRDKNQILENVFALFVPEKVARIPPLGVGILNTNAKTLTLDDGTTVLEVNGRVANTTVAPFENLQIEASIYDGSNKRITSKIIKMHNELNSVRRLQSLETDSIAEMQNKAIASVKHLAPSSVEKFRIIFTKVPENGVWFSARVYSLESETSISN